MIPTAIILPASRRGTLRWLLHLGGPSLVLVGVADNSFIPMPGSMDVMTILLAAHNRNLWIYYAMMSTAGAVLGGYITYRMARKGGKEMLEKKFSKKKVEKAYASFSRWGFAAVVIPALLPPPFPIVTMLLAAGALQYPTRKFVAALAVGRGARYTILAFLGAHYGRPIIRFFSQYYKPALVTLVALAVLGVIFAFVEYARARKRRHREKNQTQRPAPKTRAA